MDNLSKFPNRLKDLMDEADINTPSLAEKLDMEPSAISRLLRGDRFPSTPTLVKIADFFQCTTDFLLGMSDVLDERAFKQRPPFNEQLSFLIKYFKITKYKLEKETELRETTVNNWHSGKYEPTAESLVRLAKHFDCSVDFILGRET